jgi:hypothetical protein
MAIRDWHGGQLAVFWAALFFGIVVFYLGANFTDHPDLDVLQAIFGIAFLVAFLGGIAWGLVVTWKWFGGRRKPSQ